MKALLAFTTFLFATAAMADTTVFTCAVTGSNNAITMNVTLGTDPSVDYVTMTLTESTGISTFYSQMDKGALALQINSGYANMLVLDDNTSQVNGVITDAGFLALSKETNGSFTGFLAAKSNIYPLTCATPLPTTTSNRVVR